MVKERNISILAIIASIVIALILAIAPLTVNAKSKTAKTITGTVEYTIVNKGKKNEYAKITKVIPNKKGEVIVGSKLNYKDGKKQKQAEVKQITKNAFKNATKMKSCKIYSRLTKKFECDFSKCKKLKYLELDPYEITKISTGKPFRTLPKGCKVRVDKERYLQIADLLYPNEHDRLVWDVKEY